MICSFYDAVKAIELEVMELEVVPNVKEEVVIRGIIYIIVKKVFDFNDAPPVIRLGCEVRV